MSAVEAAELLGSRAATVRTNLFKARRTSRRGACRCRLHFQIVAANGGDSDARLATVEAALREVFRFDGYSLVGEGYVTASAGSFDLTTNAAGGEHAGLYGIDGRIHGDKLALDVRGPRIEFADGRWTNGRINTTLAFRPGQTLVLGSMPTPDRTVFIVVRIEADAEPV